MLPAASRLSAATEAASTPVITTPLIESLILYFLRRSSVMPESCRPSDFCTTDLSSGAFGLAEAFTGFSASSSRPSLTVFFSSLPLRTIDHLDVLADRRVGDDARQVAHLLDVLAVELDDDVAGLDAGGLGRALVVDAGDQRAARRLEVEALGDLVGDLLDLHAEPAAVNLAELLKLVDDRLHDLRRHRKADADRAAGGRDDRGVHADHVAVEVEQRTARVAAIDGGVGLDVVVVGARIDVAVARRHDAGGHRCRRG